MTANPTGTVTFLFTDIENSTKLAREHPETWDVAQSRHHVILREAIELNNGFVFQVIGDAFCAAFHKAGEALKAAVQAQENLQDEPWGENTIYVRMGIHTGEAEIEGQEYRGYTTLSFVQRLMSAGHGGQILVSSTTENLLREQLSPAISLRDMGMQKFAGVPSPVRIFQVIAPDLPTEFSPLRALDNLPNNLPIQLTSFVGRKKEIADIKRLLNNTHLLTLHGPGGTGKTRLSIQAASEMLAQYPDGVGFVEFAPILDPLLVPRTTAIAIGLRDDPQRPVIDMLCDYLHEKKMLLVLDNCEHLVDACARMADRILHAAPDTRILASSREALGIGGEVTYRVPSLELPDVSHLPPIETLNQYEAVRLFIDRAMSTVPTFTLTNDNAPPLAQVCHHLDGIPLAIELAAAKIRVLSVDEIASRLDDRLRLLIGGSRTVLERHQTLRATIDWSYELLLPAEQVLFRRLSCFVGGWRLEAAESVCGDPSTSFPTKQVAPLRAGSGLVRSEDILNLTEQLIYKSLVIKEEVHGASRYHMLETIRQYANEKLAEYDEGGQIRDRHLEYFLKLAQRAEPELYGASQIEWLQRLEDEHENMRSALEWSLKVDLTLGQQLAGALWWSWDLSGRLREGYEWLGKMLAASLGEETLIRAKLLAGAGWLAGLLGYPEQKREFAEESVALYRRLEDSVGIAIPLITLGSIATKHAEYDRANQLLNESLDLFKRAGNNWGVGFVLGRLALPAQAQGNFEQAEKFYDESLLIFREIGDKDGIAWTLYTMGGLAESQGNAAQAMELFEQALQIEKEVKSKLVTSWILTDMGMLSIRSGEYERGRLLLEEAMEIYQKTGDRNGLAFSLQSLGWCARLQGNYAKARSNYAESLELSHRSGDKEGFTECLVHVGNLMLAQGFPEKFVHMVGMAEGTVPEIQKMFTPFFRTETEKFIETARAELGDEAYTAAWETGRQMSLQMGLDRVVAYALKIMKEITEIQLLPRADMENNTSPASLPSQREAEKHKYGGLTNREREVAAQIARGKSNQAIAAELFVGLKTVEAHVTRILSKLGFTSRAQIAAWAVAKGLAEAPQDLDTLARGVQ